LLLQAWFSFDEAFADYITNRRHVKEKETV